LNKENALFSLLEIAKAIPVRLNNSVKKRYNFDIQSNRLIVVLKSRKYILLKAGYSVVERNT